MPTTEMSEPPTIDEEEYYMSVIYIESEEGEDKVGPTAGAAVRTDSGSSLYLLFSLLTARLPALGDQTTLREMPAHLDEEQEGTDHALEEEEPGKAVTALKAQPPPMGVGVSPRPPRRSRFQSR